jgi:hypothetical protein
MSILSTFYFAIFVIWYVFPVLVCCTKKNLATLCHIRLSFDFFKDEITISGELYLIRVGIKYQKGFHTSKHSGGHNL